LRSPASTVSTAFGLASDFLEHLLDVSLGESVLLLLVAGDRGLVCYCAKHNEHKAPEMLLGALHLLLEGVIELKHALLVIVLLEEASIVHYRAPSEQRYQSKRRDERPVEEQVPSSIGEIQLLHSRPATADKQSYRHKGAEEQKMGNGLGGANWREKPSDLCKPPLAPAALLLSHTAVARLGL